MKWKAHPHQLQTAYRTITDIALNHDGSRLVTVSSIVNRDGYYQRCALEVWDTATGQVVAVQNSGENGYVKVAYHPTKAHIAVASDTQWINVFTLKDNVLLQQATISTSSGAAQQITYSPDGNYFVWSGTRSINSHDTDFYQLKHKFEYPAGHYMNRFGIRPDSATIAVADMHKNVAIHRFPTGKKLNSFEHSQTMLQVHYLTPQRLLLGHDSHLALVDIATPSDNHKLDAGRFVRGITVNAAHNLMAMVSMKGDISFWNTNGEKICDMPQAVQGLSRVAIELSADGQILASQAGHGMVKVWTRTV